MGRGVQSHDLNIAKQTGRCNLPWSWPRPGITGLVARHLSAKYGPFMGCDFGQSNPNPLPCKVGSQYIC